MSLTRNYSVAHNMRSVILKGRARTEQAYLCELLSALAHILLLALHIHLVISHRVTFQQRLS